MKKEFIEFNEELSKLGPSPATYKDGPSFGAYSPKPHLRHKLDWYGKRADDYSDFYRSC